MTSESAVDFLIDSNFELCDDFIDEVIVGQMISMVVLCLISTHFDRGVIVTSTVE